MRVAPGTVATERGHIVAAAVAEWEEARRVHQGERLQHRSMLDHPSRRTGQGPRRLEAPAVLVAVDLDSLEEEGLRDNPEEGTAAGEGSQAGPEGDIQAVEGILESLLEGLEVGIHEEDRIPGEEVHRGIQVEEGRQEILGHREIPVEADTLRKVLEDRPVEVGKARLDIRGEVPHSRQVDRDPAVGTGLGKVVAAEGLWAALVREEVRRMGCCWARRRGWALGRPEAQGLGLAPTHRIPRSS